MGCLSCSVLSMFRAVSRYRDQLKDPGLGASGQGPKPLPARFQRQMVRRRGENARPTYQSMVGSSTPCHLGVCHASCSSACKRR